MNEIAICRVCVVVFLRINAAGMTYFEINNIISFIDPETWMLPP
jgi:hypothetical protein